MSTPNSTRPRFNYCFIPFCNRYLDTNILYDRAAKVNIVSSDTEDDGMMDGVTGLLAERFGGDPRDYEIVHCPDGGDYVVFFPTGKIRDKAIRRSPIQSYKLTISAVPWEYNLGERRHRFRYDVWIHLHGLPLQCDRYEDLQTIVSSFGEFIGGDERSRLRQDVRFYRLLIKCADLLMIPECITLVLGNRE